MHERKILENGMPVYLIPFEGTEAATVLVLTHVGSRFEPEKIQGASHYIEHLMFKGTERRPTTLEISRELDAVGAEFNAYTGKNITGYYVKADGAHLGLAIDLLHDMIFHSKYAEEEVDRERGVILEELKMYEDNPMAHVEELIENVLYEGSTLGRDIIGTRETLKNMTREDLVQFRDENYLPNNMSIAVSGKIDGQTMKWLEETFGQIPNGQKEPAAYEAYAGHSTQEVPKVALQTKETEQVQLAIGFPAYGLNDPKIRAASVMAKILGGTMSSRLFISVRERHGLAYFVRCHVDPVEDTGSLIIRAGLDKSRLKLATKTIMQELRKMVKEGVSEDELHKAKENIRGKLLLKMEDSSSRAGWFGTQELLNDSVKTTQAYIEEIQTVTREQVQEVAKEMLDEKKMCLSVVGPFENKETFLDAIDLT
jgi:predicted Zn-dependent peptidase